MRCAEHIARLGEMRCAYWVLVGFHEERGYFGDKGVVGKKMLKREFQEIL